MRRAAPSMPISPKLLKHFAAATVVLTAILAMFADGSTTEAVAEQVKQNELKKAQVDMVGSHRLAKSNLHVKKGVSTVPVGDDSGPSDGGGGGYAAPTGMPTRQPATGLPYRDEQGVVDDRLPIDKVKGVPPRKRRQTPTEAKRPGEAQIQQTREAAMRRTGSSSID
jgi:hypothetical protein